MQKLLLILCVVVLFCLTVFFKVKGEYWYTESETAKARLAEADRKSNHWYHLYKHEWNRYERLRTFIAKDAHE